MRKEVFCQHCGVGFRTDPRSLDTLLETHRLECPEAFFPELRKPCACGCGELARIGNTYLAGHAHRGRRVAHDPSPCVVRCACGWSVETTGLEAPDLFRAHRCPEKTPALV